MGILQATRGRSWTLCLWLALTTSVAASAAGNSTAVETLEAAFARSQWNEAAELGFEILARDPGNSAVRLRTAYALFQKGYPNAAVQLLKRLTPADWSGLIAKQDRLVEIVALFQKKVPFNTLPARLDQLNAEGASAGMRDEILFAKGRLAFEKKNWTSAQAQLGQVSRSSRFFGPASYLLGTIAVENGDYAAAATEFSKIFEPQVLSQSAEFWQDVGSDFNAHWGNSLNVSISTDALTRAGKLADLATMALARVDYAVKNFNDAMTKYGRIAKESSYYNRSRLEQVWTRLALGDHEAAEKAAAELAVDETSFEALEARPVRALVLTDAGRTEEARAEITKFFEVYDQTKTLLTRFRQFPNSGNMSPFLQHDLKEDVRLDSVDSYRTALKKEMEALRQEDRQLFPVFSSLAMDLEPTNTQAQDLSARLRDEHVARRLTDLERLYVQCKLIRAETYLEDREKLRAEFKNVGGDVEKQNEHDRRLVDLLRKAVGEVDEASKNVKERHLHLEFRQSELLWELSSATAILAQTTGKAEDRELAESYRNRSLQIARDIADHFPKFPKHAQAMFFCGFALLEMDRVAEGSEYLQKYVEMYPKHAHVPDAYRILADIQFDSNHFPQAEALYTKILPFQSSSIVGYALYKIGWCNYNQHNMAKALLGLEQAILWAKSLENSAQVLSLRREARRDLISIFAEIGDYKKALEYFDRFIGGDSASWLAELAKQYDESGLFEKSTYLYRQLLSLDPPTDQKIAYQTAIIHGAYQLRRWDQVLEATKELMGNYVELLQPVQDSGTTAYNTEKVLSQVALAQHFEFAKTETPADVERVLALDQLYLSAFSKWPSSETTLYQYAHYLLKHNRLEPAADAFRDHWTRFASTMKEPLREEALRNLIHALEQQEDSRKEGGAALSGVATDLVQYAGDYVKGYPKDKHARPIAFLRAVTLFKYHQIDQGIAETQAIFDADPTDDFGKRAFQNLKVAYYDQKDWKKAFEWASGLIARPNIATSSYAADLQTVREETLFLWADGTADNVESAKLFLKIAGDPQMANLRDKALHNAFIRYQKADMRVEALQTAATLEKAAPGFKELSSIAGVRAALYEDAGDYVSALPLFQEFLKSPPADTPPNALLQARLQTALISEAEGKTADAVLLFKQCIASAGKDDTALATEAQRGLERIETRSHRGVAATFHRWDKLVALKSDLERLPLPKGNDLAQRIQGGAQKLERVIKEFIEVSGDKATPPFYAFEAYCTVPYLYGDYQAGIRQLGDGQPKDLQAELEKLAAPLDKKATELALECIDRSQAAFHDGPTYRKVLAQWGWQADAAKKKKIDNLIALLGSHAPWIDPAGAVTDEKQLLLTHLQKGATPDTWYALAKVRFDNNELGLSRLTLLAALGKTPGSARILNALAVIEQMNRGEPAVLSLMYDKALSAGSGLAGANLTLLHLNGGRLDKGMDALKAANATGVFATDAGLQSAVTELLTPPTPPPTLVPLVQQTAPAPAGEASTPAAGASPTAAVSAATPASSPPAGEGSAANPQATTAAQASPAAQAANPTTAAQAASPTASDPAVSPTSAAQAASPAQTASPTQAASSAPAPDHVQAQTTPGGGAAADTVRQISSTPESPAPTAASEKGNAGGHR